LMKNQKEEKNDDFEHFCFSDQEGFSKHTF
jgi:hypothetical protein